MEMKPNHYDGSLQTESTSSETLDKPFILTDEMRANISGNPFSSDNKE
ncbi:hypothetical protein N0O92_22815 [Alkalihalobacillus sp. MEB130]|nr:hypothetical protein [Alkalihalobacillus sp. MEB130]MDT8863004.1 hypothetical protein [Alkalihalobacillus sp. MEB130]